MHPSTVRHPRRTPFHRVLSTLLVLLISGIPNAGAAMAFAAEVVSVEVVAGAPNGVVYIDAGASTSFPVQVSATGALHPSISQTAPGLVTIPTSYILSATGVASWSVPSSQMAFWRGGGGTATWTGAPTPYAVPATLQVAAGCPMGTYTIPITPTITNGSASSNSLENLVVDSITVIVGDTTPPTTSATPSGTLGNNGWYRSNVSVALSATDNPGGTGVNYTEYSLNAGATWTRGTSVAISNEGVTTLHYRSADHAGNIETPAKQLSIKIDKTAPSLSFTNVHNGDCLRELEPTIAYSDTVSGIAAGTFAITLNGNPYFGGVITEEGPHTLEVSVSDQAGNTANRSVSFSIDRTNPTVVITNPADEGKYNSAQTFAFTVADNFPDVTVISNPALGHIWTAEGLYAATASATDRAGNSGSDSVTFMIDKTAPQTTADLAGSLASGWFVSPVTVSLNAVDPVSGGVASGVSTTWISVDGASFVRYVPDSPVTVSGEGDHTVAFYSVDAAGNIESEGTAEFRIDTVAPEVDIALSGTADLDGWYVSAVLAELSGTDDTSGIDRIEYNLDGHGWVEYTDTLTLADGTHTLKARSFDEAGNVSTTAEETVKVDTVAPTVGIALTGTLGLDGWYTSAVTAEISGSDGMSGLGRIEYNLDGLGWAEYTGALTLSDGTHALKARSYDVAGNVSATAEETVKVDTVAPVTTCTPSRAPDHDGWYTGPVTLTLSATDGGSGVAKTFFSFDGSEWAEYTAPLVIDDPGATSVWYYSTDAAGNTEATAGPCSVKLDLADPEPYFSGVSAGDWVYEATIGFGATDPTPGSGVASVSATLNGAPFEPGTVDAEGAHTLVVAATDRAGRTAQTSVTFTIDRAAPAITITNPADGGIYNTAQTFDFTVADADPLAHVTSDPALGHTWTGEGAHTASVDARDRAGNASSQSIGFMIDMTTPETDAQIVSGTLGENGWWKSAVTVQLTASDPVSGGVSSGVEETWYRLDDGPWTEGTSLAVTAEDSHTLEFYSVDRAGNVETAGLFEFDIDTSRPSAEIVLSGTPGALASGWFVSGVAVTAIVTDAVSGPGGWQYRLSDDDPWTDYTGSLVLAHGTWNLQIRPLDVAGNIGEVVTRTVRVDTVAPVTTCTPDRAPDHNGWYTDPVTLTLAATDSGSGVAKTFYSFDGSNWDEYTAPLVIDDPGATSVWYYSEDVAGNTESVKSCSVNLDLADPEPYFSGVSAGDWVYEATIAFGATDPAPGSGVVSVAATLDGVAIPDGYVVSAEGAHTLVVTATDNAGRTGQTSVSFTIDRAAAAITILSPADGGIYNTAQTFDFTVVDADPMVDVLSDPALGHTWSAEGAYNATVNAEDRAGNASAAAIAFLIDMIAPVSSAAVTAGTPGTNGWWKSAVTVAITASDPISGGVSSGVDKTWYRLNGGAWTEGTSLSISTEGVHEVAYYSVDKAGNHEVTKTLEVKVDLNAPVVNVTSPTATTYLFGVSITAQFSASDSGTRSGLLPGAPTATLNGNAVSNGQTLVLTTAGANTFVARATDQAGHETVVTVPFTVAFVPGTILPPGSLDHTWNAGRMMPVKFTVLDASGRPTDAAVAMVDVKLHNAAGVTHVASGQAHVVWENGTPFYQFNAKTTRGQAGTLRVRITLNDGVTVMEKDIYLR